jgi:hypothetical protein
MAQIEAGPNEKEMSHPADGEAWQAFDREYPDFADDALLLMGSILLAI